MAEKLGKEEIIEIIKQMSVIELSELVKALEEEFGVSAAAPVAVAAASAPGTAEDAGAAEEEQSAFTVVIESAGENKVPVMKKIRELAPSIALREAKELVDNLPSVFLENVTKEEADAAEAALKELGAAVTIK